MRVVDATLLQAAGLVRGHTPRRIRDLRGLPAAGPRRTARGVRAGWAREGQLREEHPGLAVDCGPIFIRDGRIWTSAGVTAGMDLALALVEVDLGREVAHCVARELVLF